MANKLGEEIIIMPTPNIAIKAWLRQPREHPIPKIIPRRLPFDKEIPKTIKLSGPGVTVRMTAVIKNANI
jgi:hypothetical protein